MWYAAYLGADAPFGNRDRLGRELDRVAALGIENSASRLVRATPLKNSVTSAFRNKSRTTTRRCSRASTMRSPRSASAGSAVIYLDNFWEWSGGMMTSSTGPMAGAT